MHESTATPPISANILTRSISRVAGVVQMFAPGINAIGLKP